MLDIATTEVTPPRRGALRRAKFAPEPVRPSGGLITVGGPPLGGKQVLTARLAELLFFAIRLEAVDDLVHSDPVWHPEGPGGRAIRNPTRALLARASELWESRRPGFAPILLVSSRFATLGERRQAKRAAERLGIRFLHVEARSESRRSLRRIPMQQLSAREIKQRLERYETALRRYTLVGAAEARSLPALRLTRVHSRFEESAAKVLRAWERW